VRFGSRSLRLDRITGVFRHHAGGDRPQRNQGCQQLKQQNAWSLSERTDEFRPSMTEILFALWRGLSPSIMTQDLDQISGAEFDGGFGFRQHSFPGVCRSAAAHAASPPQAMNGGPLASNACGGFYGQPIQMGPACSFLPTQKHRDGDDGKALELLKSEKYEAFRIDIETDSTISTGCQLPTNQA